MNRLAALTTLSARLDNTLNEFALTANAEGEYPWQTAQRERRNRRMVAGAVGAAAIGAGAYGAKKAHGAVMNRAADAAQGPVRARDAYGAMAQQGMDKVKTKLGGTRVAKYGKNLAGAYGQARKGSMVMGHATGGKGMLGAAGAALRKVKFNRADQIIALEAKMDAALVEFGEAEKKESKPWPRHRLGLPAGMVATGVGSFMAGKAVGKHGVKGLMAKGKKLVSKVGKNTKEHRPEFVSVVH